MKFSFSPQSFKTPFKTPQFPGSGAAHAQWTRRAKSPETRDQLQLRGDQLQLRVPAVPWQPPHLYSHRKSAPNIHHFANTSLGPAAYKKRHSFQEGDHLQNQVRTSYFNLFKYWSRHSDK